MRKMIAAAASLLVALSLCGCEMTDTSVENLMTPPKMTDQQAQIYAAMQQSDLVEENVVLKYAQTGDYRSAIVVHDIDDEPTEEALVFYESSSLATAESANLKVCLLDQENGEWKAKWTVPINGSGLDQINFFVDRSTAKTFVLVGAEDKSAVQNSLQIFAYDRTEDGIQQFHEVYHAQYQLLEIYDIDNDRQTEIITISKMLDNLDVQNSNTEADTFQNTANLIRCLEGEFTVTDQVPTSPNVADYVNVTKAKLNPGQPALYLDEQVSATSYATEILTVQNGAFTNLIYSKDANLFEKTLRTQVATCTDINRDGQIEIPRTSYMTGYNENSTNPVYLTQWYQLVDNNLQLTTNTYINYPQGYGFIIPDEWLDKVSVRSVVANDEIEFFLYATTPSEDVPVLLSIKLMTSTDRQSSGMPDGYFEISTIGQLVFMAKIHDTNLEQYQMTEEQVRKNFINLY